MDTYILPYLEFEDLVNLRLVDKYFYELLDHIDIFNLAIKVIDKSFAKLVEKKLGGYYTDDIAKLIKVQNMSGPLKINDIKWNANIEPYSEDNDYEKPPTKYHRIEKKDKLVLNENGYLLGVIYDKTFKERDRKYEVLNQLAYHAIMRQRQKSWNGLMNTDNLEDIKEFYDSQEYPVNKWRILYQLQKFYQKINFWYYEADEGNNIYTRIYKYGISSPDFTLYDTSVETYVKIGRAPMHPLPLIFTTCDKNKES